MSYKIHTLKMRFFLRNLCLFISSVTAPLFIACIQFFFLCILFFSQCSLRFFRQSHNWLYSHALSIYDFVHLTVIRFCLLYHHISYSFHSIMFYVWWCIDGLRFALCYCLLTWKKGFFAVAESSCSHRSWWKLDFRRKMLWNFRLLKKLCECEAL